MRICQSYAIYFYIFYSWKVIIVCIVSQTIIYVSNLFKKDHRKRIIAAFFYKVWMKKYH